MKLFHKLRTFIWASGLTGFLLLFHPILTILITRRRDLSQASDLDGSSIIQIGYVVFCTFIIFRELTIFNQFLLKKIIFRSPIKFLLLFNILCFLSALWSTNTILTLYRSFECLVFLLLITLTIKKLLIKFTFDQVIEWTIWFAFWNLVVGILFRLKLVGLSGISIPFLPSRLFFPLFFFIIVLFGKKTLPKIVTIVIAIIGLSNKIFIGISMGFLSFINGSVRNKIIFVFFGISLFFIIAFFGISDCKILFLNLFEIK